MSENFDIKHLRWSKRNLSNASKKTIRKDTSQISEEVIRWYYFKKVFLKMLPPVYLQIITIDIKSIEAQKCKLNVEKQQFLDVLKNR